MDRRIFGALSFGDDCGEKDPKQWIIRQASTFWRNVGHLCGQAMFRKSGISSSKNSPFSDYVDGISHLAIFTNS
jgi:hypothetical protein